MFTHLPIVGFGFTILINIYATLNRSNEPKKLTLWAYLLMGIFALPAFLTGDSAAEIIKTYPNISKNLIETHELFGLLFFIGLMVLAAMALIGLYIAKTKESLTNKFNLYILIAALLLSMLAIKTGSSGGKIRHSEIMKIENQQE